VTSADLVFDLLHTALNASLKGSGQQGTGKKKRKKKRDLKNQTTKRTSSPPKYAVLRLPSSRGWEVAGLATAKIARCIDLGNDEPRSALAMPNLV